MGGLYLTSRTITKSMLSSSSSFSTHVPPQLSIADRTLAERASARTRKRIPANIWGFESSCSGATGAGGCIWGKKSEWAFRKGWRAVDVEGSSINDVVHGANDLDRVNVAKALRPLRTAGGDEGFNARCFPLSFLRADGGSEGSRVESETSAGPDLTSSDPTFVYPRGARRLSQTRNIAAGTRRATAISSSSGTLASTGDCSCDGSGSLVLGWCDDGSCLRSGRGRVMRYGVSSNRPGKRHITLTHQVEATGIPPKFRESQNHSSHTSLISASPRSLNLQAYRILSVSSSPEQRRWVTRTGRSIFLTYLPQCCVTMRLMVVRRSRSSIPETHKVIPEKVGRRCSSTFYGKRQGGRRKAKGKGRTASKSKSSPFCHISKVSWIHDGINIGILRSKAHWHCTHQC